MNTLSALSMGSLRDKAKKLWPTYKNVAAVRGLLQWLGVWPPVVAALSGAGVWFWTHAAHLRGPEQFILALAAFVLILVSLKLAPSALAKLRGSTLKTGIPTKDEPRDVPAPLHVIGKPKQTAQLAVGVEHCWAEECSYDPSLELLNGCAILAGNNHKCVLVAFAVHEFDLVLSADAEIIFFDHAGVAYRSVDVPIWKDSATINETISLGRSAKLVLAMVRGSDGTPFCPDRMKHAGIYLKGMITQPELRSGPGYASVRLRYEGGGSKATQRFFFSLSLGIAAEIKQINALPLQSPIEALPSKDDLSPNLVLRNIHTGGLIFTGDEWRQFELPGRGPLSNRQQAVWAELKNDTSELRRVGPISNVRAELVVTRESGVEKFSPLVWLDNEFNAVNFELADTRHVLLVANMDPPLSPSSNWVVPLNHCAHNDSGSSLRMDVSHWIERENAEIRLNLLHTTTGVVIQSFLGKYIWRDGHSGPSISLKQEESAQAMIGIRRKA